MHHPELYAIECKEEAEKKRQKELDSERKLENGEIIAGQRINLDEFDIADIVDRVIYDSNKYYDPDEMFSV